MSRVRKGDRIVLYVIAAVHWEEEKRNLPGRCLIATVDNSFIKIS
jgi:hypothetical protein